MRIAVVFAFVGAAILVGGCQSRDAPSPAEAAALAPARAAAERGELNRAIALYGSLAEDGSAFARLELAGLLERRATEDDLILAALATRDAADDGLPLAAFRYARMLEVGRGVDRNPAAARSWYQRAADGGVVEAETALGRLARDGIGMKRDWSIARRHFHAAAEAGDPEAKLALAAMLHGTAEAQRLVAAAVDDLERAAPVEPAAAERLADLHLEGQVVPTDPELAARWLLVAADGGSTEARFRLARLLQVDSDGLPASRARAARHFEIASRQGHAGARLQLARLYFSGQGVGRDPVRAMRLLESAAAAGEVAALRTLGDLYVSGVEVPADAAEAARWYEAAAEAGDGRAALELAHLYDRGAGLEPDPILALMWYEIAGSAGEVNGEIRGRSLLASLDPGEVQRAAILAQDWQRRMGAAPTVQAGLR